MTLRPESRPLTGASRLMYFVSRLLHLTALLYAYTALVDPTHTLAGEQQASYTPATPLETDDQLRYPGPSKHGGREGFVAYSVLVTPHGDAENFSIVYSNGDKSIEKELRRYYQRSKFEPAKINGHPVSSRFYSKIVFYQIGKFRGSSRRFSSDWKKFNQSLAVGNYENALKKIRAMEKVGHRSLYEEFYIQLAWTNYYLKLRDGAAAYERLKLIAALYHSTNIDSETVIPRNSFFSPLIDAYQYAINSGLIGDANALKEILRDIGPGSQAATAISNHFANAAEEVSNQVLKLELELKTWPVGAAVPATHIGLHRRRFSIEALSGNLSDATVVCKDWQRTLTPSQYPSFTIPTNLEDCSLHFLGSEATRISVALFPDSSAHKDTETP